MSQKFQSSDGCNGSWQMGTRQLAIHRDLWEWHIYSLGIHWYIPTMTIILSAMRIRQGQCWEWHKPHIHISLDVPTSSVVTSLEPLVWCLKLAIKSQVSNNWMSILPFIAYLKSGMPSRRLELGSAFWQWVSLLCPYHPPATHSNTSQSPSEKAWSTLWLFGCIWKSLQG